MSTVYLHYTGDNQITDNTNQADTRNSAIQALYSIQAQKQSGTHTGHGLPNCFSALPVQLRCAFCRLHYFTGFNDAMITIKHQRISSFRLRCQPPGLPLRFNNLSRPGRPWYRSLVHPASINTDKLSTVIRLHFCISRFPDTSIFDVLYRIPQRQDG
ncbi:Uncharacterised protein [Salmonella enterica subsp. enterica]|uniref:Uncharacterized protein n=1 Tax=Salmonella enterica I TaxID=59201 RepID=A0A379VR46_SALET|nr:Uncharacterised protein [Salmonella enterica subsp. enterica]